MQIAALDELEPPLKDYLDKLERLNAAVVLHVHEEETGWFPRLRDACDATAYSRLSARYGEEAKTYLGAKVR